MEEKDKDFIRVRKSNVTEEYDIEIYFSFINATLNIHLIEKDFILFLHNSIQLINNYSSKFKLEVPKDIQKIVNQYNFEKADIVEAYEAFKKIKHYGKPIAVVIIYIKDKAVSLKLGEEITNITGDFMEALGFKSIEEHEPIYGSFFKKLELVYKRTIGKEDVEDLYEKGKKALELQYVELPSAEQTEKLSIAALNLVNSLEKFKEGVIKCGSLLIVKKEIDNESKLIIQQLSTEMIILLDKSPKLLTNVDAVYELLSAESNNMK